MKIATWNVNSVRVRLPHILSWVAEHQPDILALQEIKITDELFPFADIQAAGYSVVASGQKSYNGVAILSRDKVTDLVTEFPSFNDAQRRILAATIGDLRILNLYIPNGETITSQKYQYKLNWLNQLNSFLQTEVKKYQNIIVLGDFNIAPHEIDLYDPQIFNGKVLFSEPERQAFHSILNLGFEDCLRLNTQDQLFTWWDYRLNSFKRNLGVRIDHILSTIPFAKNCTTCYIDKIPRGWERPSDHAPVIAEFC